MKSIMLDLETWGTAPGSALRSIGAIAFEPDGQIGDEFYRNIDEQSCLDAGLTIDPSTVAWWEKQSLESRAALMVDQMPLLAVIGEFEHWWREQGAKFVWSHGANFDEPLWTAACRAHQCRPPWDYWNTRCTRTLFHIANLDPRSMRRSGTHHNALDDCRFQIECVHKARAMLRATEAA
jgi:hypothetical protein